MWEKMCIRDRSNERYDKEVAICEDFYQNKVCGIIVSQAKTLFPYTTLFRSSFLTSA